MVPYLADVVLSTFVPVELVDEALVDDVLEDAAVDPLGDEPQAAITTPTTATPVNRANLLPH